MNDDNNFNSAERIDSPVENNHKVNPSEPSEDHKLEIAKWVAAGMGLSDVQKKINSDFGIVLTYMDVRFLVDDLDLTLVDPKKPALPKVEESVSDIPSLDDQSVGGGGVQVEVDGVTPPGAMASGSVVFSDGESKKWSVDQFGRLAMTGGSPDYKPSDQDVMEFQQQLEQSLRGPSL
jgi:hypothetical protein